MGNSDNLYFPWVAGVLGRWGAGLESAQVLVLGAHHPDAAVMAVSPRGSVVTYWDLVLGHNFNDLRSIPSASADVILMTRCSHFILDLGAFFRSLARILRPGGRCYIDWASPHTREPIEFTPLRMMLREPGGPFADSTTTYVLTALEHSP